MHWLCGLIPSDRMYQVCVDMPSVSLESQFIRGALELWPSIRADSQDDARLHQLHPPQKNAIKMLQQAEASGVYCLQGPPGTGKKQPPLVFVVTQLVHTRPTEKKTRMRPFQSSRAYPP
jgi:hypothetical protein